MRFYRVLKILKAFVSFFSFNFKIIELNMSSKSNIYSCAPGCTQKGTVDPEGNGVGLFGLPNDQMLPQHWLVKIRRDVGPHFKPNKRMFKLEEQIERLCKENEVLKSRRFVVLLMARST